MRTATLARGKARDEYSACPLKMRAITTPKMARPATPDPTAMSPRIAAMMIRSLTPWVMLKSRRSKYIS